MQWSGDQAAVPVGPGLETGPRGLAFLAKELLKLAERAKSGDLPHDHYFTEEWGGYQLSSDQQSGKDRLVNHVKIYGWPTKEGGKPYR